MKYFLFLLFFVTVFSKKFSLKIINTPIYKSIPIFLFHSIVFIETNDFENLNNEKNEVFAIDFSPIEDIGNPSIIFKLLQGKQIKGKIRISRFSKEVYKNIFSKEHLTNTFYSKKTTIFEGSNTQLTDENLKRLDIIDPYLVSIIKYWGSSFQIYKRNCRHFSRFLQKHYCFKDRII